MLRSRSTSAPLSARIAIRDIPGSRYRSLIDVLEPGTTLSIHEICMLALATSDNRLADFLVGLIDRKEFASLLRHTGCSQTHLEVGFSDDDLDNHARDNTTSASDMVRFVKEILTSTDLADLMEAMGRCVQGTRITARLSPMLQTGHKTGSLDGVCNDVGFASDGTTTMIMAFLCSEETDNMTTSFEIADCARRIWIAHTGIIPEEIRVIST